MITITIHGEPASKANSRQIVTIRGRPASIKSKKARGYASSARIQLEKSGIQPFSGDVVVEMTIYYASRRPDLDESVILDVLQGYAYHNDRQVRTKHIYGDLDKANPRAEIKIYTLEEWGR